MSELSGNFNVDVRKLAQVDVDAVRLYEQALKRIDVAGIHAHLQIFHEDHQRHVRQLSAALAELGDDAGVPPVDLKGLLAEGLTALRSIAGTESALRTVRNSEEEAVRRYRAVAALPLPEALRKLVNQQLDDEIRHLRYLEETLDTRVRLSDDERPATLMDLEPNATIS